MVSSVQRRVSSIQPRAGCQCGEKGVIGSFGGTEVRPRGLGDAGGQSRRCRYAHGYGPARRRVRPQATCRHQTDTKLRGRDYAGGLVMRDLGIDRGAVKLVGGVDELEPPASTRLCSVTAPPVWSPGEPLTATTCAPGTRHELVGPEGCTVGHARRPRRVFKCSDLPQGLTLMDRLWALRLVGEKQWAWWLARPAPPPLRWE